MTVAFFREQMTRLMGLRFAPADFDTHWEALHELPPDVLEAAVTRAQRTRVEFPTPVELRMDADIARPRAVAVLDAPERETPLEQPYAIPFPQAGKSIPVQRIWKYYCEACSDLGWQSVWCGDPKNPSRKPWQEPRTCDRRGEHAPHEWVRHCGCFDTNPALVRKREANARYAAEPPRKGRS